MRLTDNRRSWGFGLCFLYLRNVKGLKWNHKRVYRIYKELELNLRIKPRKRLVRENPEALTVPEGINQVWSMVCRSHASAHPLPLVFSQKMWIQNRLFPIS